MRIIRNKLVHITEPVGIRRDIPHAVLVKAIPRLIKFSDLLPLPGFALSRRFEPTTHLHGRPAALRAGLRLCGRIWTPLEGFAAIETGMRDQKGGSTRK